MEEIRLKSLKLPEQQQAYVLKRLQAYNGLQNKIAENLSSSQKDDLKEYQETLRNLAIISGAIATFSLMLLNIFKSNYLVAGICLLLVLVIMCFAHIFGLMDNRSRGRIKNKKTFLRPVQEMSKHCIDFLRGKKTFEEWLAPESNFLENKYDELKNGLEILSEKEDKLDYTVDFFVAIFSIATLLIIFSILNWAIVPQLTTYFGA